MGKFVLRVPGGQGSVPIDRADYERLHQDWQRLQRRMDAEVLFDHLAENVVEWRQAMTRFVVRSSSSGARNWFKDMMECRLLLRAANVLSAAFSFTESTDQNEEHRTQQCGNPMCTIARGLRNQIQHGIVKGRYEVMGDAVWISAPQMKRMPSSGKKEGMRLTIRWPDVAASMKHDRKRQFKDACRTEFPDGDRVDAVLVINSHVNCLSNGMQAHRRRLSIEKTLDKAQELLRKAEPLKSRRVEAAAQAGEPIWLKGPKQVHSLIEDLMDRNEKIADVELVQFSGGSPTRGDLDLLKQSIDSFLKGHQLADVSTAEMLQRFSRMEIDLPAGLSSSTESEKLVETVDRLYASTQQASGSLWTSSLALRRIEAGLSEFVSKRPKLR